MSLIYKGGNTVYNHLRYLLTIYDSNNLNTIFEQSNIGDWDYNIKIEFNNITDIKQFIKSLRRYIERSLSLIYTDLEGHISYIYNNGSMLNIMNNHIINTINEEKDHIEGIVQNYTFGIVNKKKTKC